MYCEVVKACVIVVSLCLGIAASTHGRIIYADDDAAGHGDGSSWANAYRFLQDALAGANDSVKPVEIRVAQGIYRPDQGSNLMAASRSATFELIDGVALRGGYAGLPAGDPDSRDVDKYRTTLSGDLLGNDAPAGHPRDLGRHPSRSDNSEHVVTGVGITATAILDGFAITGGTHGDRPRNGVSYGGAGVFLSAAGPTLVNCRFEGNYVGTGSGGGLFNTNGSHPRVTDCVSSGNLAPFGGAICNQDKSNAMIVDCMFYNNCAISGGALGSRSSALDVSNCVFVGNRGTYGGAIHNWERSLASVVSCTFHGNHATSHGGAIWSSASLSRVANRIRNCIVHGNAPDEIFLVGPETIVAYCNIRGGWPGEANIDVEPLFAEPGYWDPNGTPDEARDDFWVDGDYHLKSQAGRWDPVSESWVQDDVTSPCIDAGDPNSPIGHESFPNGGRVNMGAYGGTVEASKSYFGEPVCETVIAGDINGDCRVDLKDFQIMAFHWLQERRTAAISPF